MDTVEIQIADRLVAVCRSVPGIEGASYDEPLDFERPDQPHVYVYEHDVEYDVQTSGHTRNRVQFTTVVTFRYDDDGDDSLRRKGQRLGAEVTRHIAADAQLFGGVAFDCLPVAAVTQDLGVHAQRLGARIIVWEASYFGSLTDPYTLA